MKKVLDDREEKNEYLHQLFLKFKDCLICQEYFGLHMTALPLCGGMDYRNGIVVHAPSGLPWKEHVYRRKTAQQKQLMEFLITNRDHLMEHGMIDGMIV